MVHICLLKTKTISKGKKIKPWIHLPKQKNKSITVRGLLNYSRLVCLTSQAAGWWKKVVELAGWNFINFNTKICFRWESHAFIGIVFFFWIIWRVEISSAIFIQINFASFKQWVSSHNFLPSFNLDLCPKIWITQPKFCHTIWQTHRT